MFRVRQIKVDALCNTNENIKRSISKKLKIKEDDIINFYIKRQSLDARDKNKIFYVYEVDVEIKNVKKINLLINNKDITLVTLEEYNFVKKGNKILKNKPVIVGSGPAGLFCAYILSEEGYNPIIIERGEKIEDRIKSVDEFWKTGELNHGSNVQFGEGGAGTFSDGKLNTLVSDKNFRMKKVFEIFVDCGAPKEILYSYKPHIGTDILRTVIKNMREKIKSIGGQFLYNSCLTNIDVVNNKLKGIEINHKYFMNCDVLVLAIGHSARDTFKMLFDSNINMVAKPFAVGVRVQHSQDMINHSQYGDKYKDILPPANYKLAYKSKSGRGVYSFCMCPGGYVVNASSEAERLVINGMSNHDRNSVNANSAIVVTVNTDDFGTHPLDGVEFQRRLEEDAYKLGSGKIPIQLLKDFKENRITTKLGNVNAIFKGEYTFGNLNQILLPDISSSIKDAMEYFGDKIKGFDNDDTILAAIESRTSSPVRIIRDDSGQANILGVYPCGEGAGYAGGITSASMDGIKIAEKIGSKYKPEFLKEK